MKRSRIIEIIQEEIQSVLNEQDLNEMANFFELSQDQINKIDPENYKGTKKAVAQALKDKIKPGQKFTKADIKRIIGKDPLGNFKSVLDSEKVGTSGRTADVKPKAEKKPSTGKRGRPAGKTAGMDDNDKEAIKSAEKDEVAKSASSTPDNKKEKFNLGLKFVKKYKDDKPKIDAYLKKAKEEYKLPKSMLDDLKRASGRDV